MVSARNTRSHPSSLRRLRTAFSPSRSPTISITSDCSTSPLSHTSSSSSRFSHFTNFSNLSNLSLGLRNVIRRSPSQIAIEQEEEKRSCGDELLGLIEPRPMAPVVYGGIEEVMFGRI
ncbi:hypothetical protein H2203_001270 [Taxawa tesnikishii (nom. ined.)]|nr:hypothetical protein H2203_001270 [Dothideales sp. JES 119]